MAWGVRWYLVGSIVLGVLGTLAGCSGSMFFAEREPWRHDAEVQCLSTGAVKESAGITRVGPIRGPGICGADFPLKVSILGESAPLGYSGDLRPPADIPRGSPRTSVREPVVPVGPSRDTAASFTPVAVSPSATLACPMVSELERWITGAVQPAAMRWFGSPVAEIRQISAYSCRGMNGNPRANISEHAFGNALDIASFTLADGR